MRKLKLFLSMLMLIAFSVGNVWATEEDVDLSAGTFANGTITWKAASNGITITQTKAASTTNVNSSYVAAPRIYKGQILSFEASGTCKITQIDIVYDGSNKGGTITAGVAISENTVTDNTSAISRTLGTANGGTHTFSSVDEGGLSAIYIQNPANASAQLRPTKITITYVGGSSKTLSSVTVSGTPTKKEYSAGDEFEPAGLTVKGTYDDSSVEDITSGITWTYNPSQTLVKDQTSIGVVATVSSIASAEYNVTGLTVTAASPKITITQDEVADFTNTYAEYTWTAGDVSGKMFAYKNSGMQFNSSKTGYYVYNTDAIPGRITKITMTQASGTARTWTPYVSTTAMTAPDAEKALDAKSVTTAGVSWDVTGSNSYFYLTVAGGSTVIGSIVIEYTEEAGPAVDAPSISGDVNFVGSTTVTISHEDADHIYYTTNGDAPTTSSAEYTAPFSLTNSATVKAIAVKSSDVSAVAEKTFTKITPLSVAAAITAIPNKDDVVNNQYVSGIVCTAGASVSSGKMTYYISDDGSETSRLQIYKGKNLKNTDFTAVSDLAIGDRVVVFGQLKNYNGTPEMNDGNYLVSKAAPAVAAPTFSPDGGGFMGETDVTITCATASSSIYYTLDGSAPSKLSTLYEGAIHLDATTTITAIAYVGEESSLVVAKEFTLTAPMTVADALTALDTEDPINNVAVAGIISTAPTANPSSGKLTYYISDDGTDTDELEVFLGFGLNGASFSAKTDLQVGDEVTVFGNLTIFNSTTKEFASGSRLLAFNRPVVPVSSVELASAATVKVGNSINLSASVLPANATDKVIEWSIQSGNDNITLDNGAVTGVAEGTAVVRATSHADNTKYAECTITIEAADPTYAYYFYGKVTETAGIEDGQYLIVYEDESVAFNGGLETLDAAHNTIAVEIEDGLIVSNATTDAASFTIGVTAGTIQAAMGDYIGVTSYSNGLKQNADATTYPAHSFSIDEEENAIFSLNDGWSGTMILNYNTGTSDKRFRYYKNGSQKKIQLYKRFGTDVAPKANPQLAWDPADDIEITVGDEFTAPTLTYVEGFDGVAAVAIESDNTDLAIVTAGVVSLVADATGEANITATFAGNDNYKAATASYKITVNASVVPPTPAVSGNVIILAEYNSKFYAMTNSLTSGALAGVEVEKDGSKIVVSSAEDKVAIQWTATVDGDNTTLKDADDYYIKGSSGASLSLEADPYNWNWDGEKSCYISSAYTNRGLFFSNSGNVFKGYALSNITSDGYAATEVIEIDPEDIVISSKVDPELAYTPASDEITVGDAWSAPVLGYVEGFDGLAAITYASNNEAVATVSDAGVIALAGGTGTATITATFGGNANYLAGSATYTVKVNEPAEDCDGSDDFSTATNTSASSYNVERTTTNGWSSVNSALTTINSEARWLTMLGKTSQVGVITSPTLNDGIASLKIRYANTFNETNGVSFRVDIKQGEDIVKTYTITKENSEVEKGTVYTEIIENINVAGDFQMIFTNLCPSNADSNKDRVSIGKLCWEGYAAPEPPTPVYETVREGLECGRHYTVCLENNVTDVKGATFWSLTYKNAASTEVYLVQENAPFAAGTPYIIQATGDNEGKLEVVYGEEVASSAGTSGALVGTFSYLNAEALNTINETGENKVYILFNNELRRIGSNNHLDAHRAYVLYNLLEEEPAQGFAPGKKVKRMPMQSQTTTDCELINAAEAPAKMMINGQLFILRGEKKYDATGRLVK